MPDEESKNGGNGGRGGYPVFGAIPGGGGGNPPEDWITHYTIRPSKGALCGDDMVTLTGKISLVTCPDCLSLIAEATDRAFSPPEGFSPLKKTTSGREAFSFSVDHKVSDQARAVINMLPAWINLFVKKNQDYTNSGGQVADNFGIMGQFMKLTDKVHKLRKPLWDCEIQRQAGLAPDKNYPSDLNFEDAAEILDDIIGHCMLTKLYLKEQKK